MKGFFFTIWKQTALKLNYGRLGLGALSGVNMTLQKTCTGTSEV